MTPLWAAQCENVEHTAARVPDGLAVISRHQSVRLSYSGLNDAAEDRAPGLLRIGLRVGDRIGI